MSASTLPKKLKLALSTAEAAEAIGVHVKTLRNWRAMGLGPAPTRLSPSQVVYRVEDIDAWLRAVKKAGSMRAVPFGGAK